MNRKYLTDHLIGEGCYCEPGTSSSAGEWWINSINGETCLVPLDEEIEVTTYCHIFYELRIDPPRENGYDSDFDVYSGWRNLDLNLAKP